MQVRLSPTASRRLSRCRWSRASRSVSLKVRSCLSFIFTWTSSPVSPSASHSNRFHPHLDGRIARLTRTDNHGPFRRALPSPPSLCPPSASLRPHICPDFFAISQSTFLSSPEGVLFFRRLLALLTSFSPLSLHFPLSIHLLSLCISRVLLYRNALHEMHSRPCRLPVFSAIPTSS